MFIDTWLIVFVGIIVAVFMMAVVVHFYVYTRYRYVCPKCSKKFQPPSFISSMFSPNFGEKRMVNCPYCNSSVLAKAEKEKNSSVS
jgi:DNA-directed RNA polymerase subunit RPC12/RpoP